MADRRTQPTFRFATVAAVLSLASALLLAVAWGLVPILIGEDVGGRRAVAWAAVTVWGSSLAGIVPVALLHPRGLMPAVNGYFIGAAIRVVACILATVIAVRSTDVTAGPWVATLLGMYIPLLFLEAAMVGHSVWDYTDRPKHEGGPFGAEVRRDCHGNAFVETLR